MTMVWAIAVSIFCVGGMIGGMVTGLVADGCGRKNGLLLNNILVIISSILQGNTSPIQISSSKRKDKTVRVRQTSFCLSTWR